MCLYLVLLYAFVGLAGVLLLAGGEGFAYLLILFRGSKRTVRHPGKAAFLEQFGLTVRWCSGKNVSGVF